MAGAPKGNNNATKGRPWREAIDRAIKRDRSALDNVANALIIAAQGGDMQAIKELGDRLDGKPTQYVEGNLRTSIVSVLASIGDRESQTDHSAVADDSE